MRPGWEGVGCRVREMSSPLSRGKVEDGVKVGVVGAEELVSLVAGRVGIWTCGG